ncbi:MAG: hypothetical protein A2X36_05075 [Elusimicrobia bacterium GWA2_69_24]|nr:MAG: hypothetical protein A2X52_15400 [Candidatus Rokubacteria bacterium GWC2_70_16]OGK89594.1 MAG: hypothetical protein A2W08_17475 [Candidatus Rokubacteria bacterium RBG_16_73_20]OGR61028.1 MAG: hypothetical protein A2X36_05075 [Elusimicrobia bacterium GWA2_69_24]
MAGSALVERIRYARYLWSQIRQTRAKRDKDARFRLVPFVELVRVRCADLAPDAPVLSIGARNEVELEVFAAAGFTNVTAIDLYSRSRRVRRMDMHRLRFPDASFGLVFASHAFEHAWDFPRVARECARVLRPGGYVFSATPRDFVPDAHDRYCFDRPEDLLAHFAPARPRVIHQEIREGELRLLFRLEAPRCAGR